MSLWRSIHEITPTLYLSSGTAVSNKQAVLDKKINCIINATIDLPNRSWNSSIEVIRVPVNDVPHAQIYPYFDKVADLIEQKSRRGERCLVHCVAGVSRSASLCIAYLIKYHRMTLKQAHSHVRHSRPVIRPNVGFWKQLIDYEKKMRGTKSVAMVHSPIGLIPDIYLHETRNMVAFVGGSRR
uniref:protein-serine/threonine phosphatase n=1 Tax=Phallusia mammillata TaxID=59560 RepID=A0A6F9DAV2_9ASCI|nr:dual specificity protein phosphatase 14-like [Phallusia mammillata]